MLRAETLKSERYHSRRDIPDQMARCWNPQLNTPVNIPKQLVQDLIIHLVDLSNPESLIVAWGPGLRFVALIHPTSRTKKPDKVYH